MNIDQVNYTIKPDNVDNLDYEDLKHHIELKIYEALEILIHEDKHLINTKTNERSLTYLLGMYLQSLFQYWDVDCEYNRFGYETKSLDLPPKNKLFEDINDDDLEAKTVYPDIIVHERGSKGKNLIVIEAKKSGKKIDDNILQKNNFIKYFKKDYLKLKGYSNSDLNYKFAYFITINTSNTINPPYSITNLNDIK